MSRLSGSKKTGGRQAGTPNKKTLLLQDILDAKGLNPAEKLCELLPTLRPKEQSQVLLELLGYLYPRRKAVELSQPNGEALFTSFTALMKQVADSEPGVGMSPTE